MSGRQLDLGCRVRSRLGSQQHVNGTMRLTETTGGGGRVQRAGLEAEQGRKCLWNKLIHLLGWGEGSASKESTAMPPESCHSSIWHREESS